MRFVTESYPAILDPYLKAAGELSAQWYSEQPTGPRRKGSQLFLPMPAPLPPSKQLAASARWATTQADPAGALRGASTRHTFNSSRKTIIDNVEREGVKYARHADITACGFCRMLATRSVTWTLPASGSLYRTGLRARQSPHNKALEARGHDNCNCVVVAVRDGDYNPPDYVLQWTEDYYAARKADINDPAAIARAMEVAGANREKSKVMGSLFDQVPDVPVAPKVAAAVEDAPAAAASWLEDDLAAQISPAAEASVSKLDQVLADANAALEAGEFDRADKLFAKAEKLEVAETAKAAKQAAKTAAEEATKQAEIDRVIALVESGWDAAEAEAEVYGVTVESIRRRDFINQSRRDGHVGAGFDELLTSVFSDWAAAQYYKAEAETLGVLKNQYVGKYSALDLWKVNEATARKIMTEEMARWFDDQGGRVTRDIFRQSVLDGSGVFDTSQQAYFN